MLLLHSRSTSQRGLYASDFDPLHGVRLPPMPNWVSDPRIKRVKGLGKLDWGLF